MVEHHFMVFSTKSGLFISAKWRVCGISMVLAYPNPNSLSGPWHLKHFVCVAGPNTGSQTINGVVCNFNGLLSGFKGSKRNYRPEYFFLENTHLIIPFQNCRLDIISIFSIAVVLLNGSTNQYF